MGLGTAFYLLVIILYPDSITNGIWGQIYKWFLDIIKLLSSVVISSGFISLLLEISTIKNLVLEVYHSLLKADFDFTYYSNERLRKMRKDIILAEYAKDFLSSEQLNDSIYILEEPLNKLIKNKYQECHESTFWIIPNSYEKIFKKRVKSKYTVYNYFKSEDKIGLQFKVTKNINATDLEKESWLIINSFMIESTNLTSEAKQYIKVEDIPKSENSPYTHIIKFSMPLQKYEKYTIQIEYEYDVPMFDIMQSFKLMWPCKTFRHKVYLQGKEASNWALSVNGFASFYYAGSELEDKFKVLPDTEHSVEIFFEGWTLPGAGYVVSLRKIS